MFALDALLDVYPDARFLWSHRDPAKVLGSVCSLVHYTRSWSSARDDAAVLGEEMTERWWEAVRRAMEFRARVGDDRFADIAFTDLQIDPVGALERAYSRIGLDMPLASRAGVAAWAGRHEPGSHGSHAYELSDFGIDADTVHARFAPYMAKFDAAE